MSSEIDWVPPPLVGPFLAVVSFVGFIAVLQLLTVAILTVLLPNALDAPNPCPADEVQEKPTVNTTHEQNNYTWGEILEISSVKAADTPAILSENQVLGAWPMNTKVLSSPLAHQGLGASISDTVTIPKSASQVRVADVPPPSLKALGGFYPADNMKSISKLQTPYGVRQIRNPENVFTTKRFASAKWKRHGRRFADTRSRRQTAKYLRLHHVDKVRSDVGYIRSKSDIEILLRDHKGTKEEKRSYLFHLKDHMVQSWKKKIVPNGMSSLALLRRYEYRCLADCCIATRMTHLCDLYQCMHPPPMSLTCPCFFQVAAVDGTRRVRMNCTR